MISLVLLLLASPAAGAGGGGGGGAKKAFERGLALRKAFMLYAKISQNMDYAKNALPK